MMWSYGGWGMQQPSYGRADRVNIIAVELGRAGAATCGAREHADDAAAS